MPVVIVPHKKAPRKKKSAARAKKKAGRPPRKMRKRLARGK